MLSGDSGYHLLELLLIIFLGLVIVVALLTVLGPQIAALLQTPAP